MDYRDKIAEMIIELELIECEFDNGCWQIDEIENIINSLKEIAGWV